MHLPARKNVKKLDNKEQNMNFINLRFSGDLLVPDQLTKMFNIKPDFECIKGGKTIFKGQEIIYKEGCWNKGIEVQEDDDILRETTVFLNEFMPYKDQIFMLSNKYSITLWITLYPVTVQNNFHITPQLINMINQLGISIDISNLFLKDLYENNDSVDQKE